MSSSSLSRLFAGSRRSAARPLRSSAAASPDPTPGSPSIPNPMRASGEGTASLVGSLFKERDLDRLVSRFKAASADPRFRSRHRVYEVAVSRLAAAGRFDGVSAILEAQKGYSTDISREGFAARVIVLYGRAGMAAAAEETFRQLPALGCGRTALSFNALLAACAEAGDFEKVDELFRSVPAENPEISPDEVTYNVMIGSMCKRNDLDAAMCMLEMMEERGLQPSLITFNTLLNGYYKNGRFSDAEEVWAKMAKKNCQPNVKSFNAKLRGLVSVGRTSEAVGLVGQLPSMGLKPDTFSFNAVIKGYCRDGNLEDAKKVFEDLTKKDCRPNRETFEALVPALCQEGQLDLALRLCNESVSRKCYVAAEMLQGVVDGLCGDSRVEDAKKLVELAWANCDNGKKVRLPSSSTKVSMSVRLDFAPVVS